MHGATSSFLLLVAMPFVTSSFLLLLVVVVVVVVVIVVVVVVVVVMPRAARSHEHVEVDKSFEKTIPVQQPFLRVAQESMCMLDDLG